MNLLQKGAAVVERTREDKTMTRNRTSSRLLNGETVGPTLLETHELSVDFMTTHGQISAVNDFDLSVNRGESVAIVGESGSGKSVAMRAVMGLYPKSQSVNIGGSVTFNGRELTTLPRKQLRSIQGSGIALIAQDALSSLNPSLTVEYQITEALRIHKGWGKARGRRRAVELMELVGIPAATDRLKDYPHQFSGGMRQRVLIAAALALDPEVLIADEPTTALDVTIQAQILELLSELRKETGMALVMITHDMGVVAEIAEHVNVMYAGSTVESGPVRDVFDSPRHPYTEGLLKSVPRANQRGERMASIPGTPPSPTSMPSGCPFHPRCPYSREECRSERVTLELVAPGRTSACLFWKEIFNDE